MGMQQNNKSSQFMGSSRRYFWQLALSRLPTLSLTCFVHNIVGTYQFCLGRSVVLLVDETSETVAARCSFQSPLEGCSNLPNHFQTVKLLMLVGINVTSTT